MSTYLDCWISVATSLLPQALAGEPRFIEGSATEEQSIFGIAFSAWLEGDIEGVFTVALDPLIFEAALLGEGEEQRVPWGELLREVAEAAAGELLASSGKKCRVKSFSAVEPEGSTTRVFQLRTAAKSWSISVRDDLRISQRPASEGIDPLRSSVAVGLDAALSPGVELLLDVELEAALRFGRCEMPLGEILELGPGDVVELDRHVTDPVDLIVGNKIVARGDVVLIDGNFGLRVTEVATPQKRLESIRCLF
jgi:flagellar motor switch protein FliN